MLICRYRPADGEEAPGSADARVLLKEFTPRAAAVARNDLSLHARLLSPLLTRIPPPRDEAEALLARGSPPASALPVLPIVAAFEAGSARGLDEDGEEGGSGPEEVDDSDGLSFWIGFACSDAGVFPLSAFPTAAQAAAGLLEAWGPFADVVPRRRAAYLRAAARGACAALDYAHKREVRDRNSRTT